MVSVTVTVPVEVQLAPVIPPLPELLLVLLVLLVLLEELLEVLQPPVELVLVLEVELELELDGSQPRNTHRTAKRMNTGTTKIDFCIASPPLSR